MLDQIFTFLLDVIVDFLGGACLLRLYMQYHRVPFGNPLGRFVFAVTDWIVLPLRRVVPPVRRWDLSSGVAAWLLVLARFLLAWLLMGVPGLWRVMLVSSLLKLLSLTVTGLTALLIVYAVLSWVPGASPMLHDLIAAARDSAGGRYRSVGAGGDCVVAGRRDRAWQSDGFGHAPRCVASYSYE